MFSAPNSKRYFCINTGYLFHIALPRYTTLNADRAMRWTGEQLRLSFSTEYRNPHLLCLQ